MKKLTSLIFVFIVLFLFTVNAQQSSAPLQFPQGQALESLVLKSKLLNDDVKYCIYLPSDYETSTRRYPVVYLLHGYSDDETGWVQFGEANLIADEAIANREIPPMIIVMPDAKVTWYMNDSENKFPYEDMFIKELIPHIDATYRTRTKKEFRGISGLSMGGFGSLMLSMRNSDMFTACAAFSAGVFTDEEIMNLEAFDHYFGPVLGNGLKGEARLTNHWKEHNPIDIVKNKPLDELKKVRFYLDCGDDDFLSKGNTTLHEVMREYKVPHEFRMRNGAHTWSYWRSGLKDGLKFIGESFHR